MGLFCITQSRARCGDDCAESEIVFLSEQSCDYWKFFPEILLQTSFFSATTGSPEKSYTKTPPDFGNYV